MLTAGKSLFNLALRGLSMGGRFLLIFYMGKYFSLEDLGSYGIFFTTVTLALFLLGLDFYGFSNRELLLAENHKRLSILRAQLLFYAFTYLVFLPPLYLLFTYDVLPFKFVIFFYVILVLEHFAQELYRIFTILGLPIFSNFLLFLRSAAWVYIILAGWLLVPALPESLEVLWWAWIAGAGLSIVVGVWKLVDMHSPAVMIPMPRAWFMAGLRISMLYFASTIALKIIEYSSRYFIEYWVSLEDVGIFTFYNQIANMINIVIFTLFTMVVYPKMVVAVKDDDITELRRLKKYMINMTLVYSVSLGIFVVIAMEPVLMLMNKIEFKKEIYAFYVLVGANIVLNIGFVYHYLLYAFRKDFSLFIATVTAAACNMILNVVLIKHYGIIGAAVATFLSFLILAVVKAVLARKAEVEYMQNRAGI